MKGILFSMDALFAMAILIVVVPLLLVFPFQNSEQEIFSILQMEAEDSINVISNIRIRDIRTEQVIDDLFISGVLTNDDLNETLLDTIGSLWASSNITLVNAANNISQNIINQLIPDTVEWKLTIDDDVVYNSTGLINKTVTLSKRVISGVVKGGPAQGFISDASIKGIEKRASSYIFYGGFIGQGNITTVVRDIPQNSNVTSLYLELNAAHNFTFNINGNHCDNMSITPGNFTVDKWTIINSGCLNLIQGGIENNFTINFTGNLSTAFIGGGFLKISYDTEEFLETPPNRYYFPGVEGLVNIYDSFFVNGNITSMNITLHYETAANYSVKMILGNATILNLTSNGTEENIFLDSISIQGNLSESGLSYSLLNDQTIPLRLLVSANITGGSLTGDTDIILITDRSGSMDWRLNVDSATGNEINDCNDPNLFDNETKRISLARCLAKDFVHSVLGSPNSTCPVATVTGNRIGLVSFGSDSNDYLSLTNNLTNLITEIETYDADLGATCVSCAINRAWEILNSESNFTRKKYVVVMTDGETNRRSTSSCSSTYGIDATNLNNAHVVGYIGHTAKLNGNFWEPQGFPVTDSLWGVSMVNETLGFAVGASGKIVEWDGSSWIEINDFGSFTFHDVSVINDTLAFAVGDGGRIYIWDGNSWSLDQDMGNTDIRGVAGIDGIAFAVAESARIYEWDGSSWSQINDFGSFTFYDIAFENSTHAFAVASSGRIYEWDGNSWSLDQDVGSSSLRGVDAINGLAIAVGTGARIYEWTGGSWTNTADTGSETHRSVSIHNSTLAYVVSSNGNSGDALLYEWDGNSWTLFKPFVKYAYSGNSTNDASCSDSSSDSLPLNQSYPALNSNYSAFRIVTDFGGINYTNITIDSIGFGPVSEPTRVLARETLQSIATTGNGTYYASSDGATLQNIYCQIAENINTRQTLTQILLFSGDLSPAKLFTDSFIEYEFNSSLPPVAYQEIDISIENDPMSSCTGSFFIPDALRVVNSRITSYSSDLWTSFVHLENTINNSILNLSVYNINFTNIGDPFVVRIPEHLITINSTNYLNVGLGSNLNNISESCSTNNRFIYDARFRASVPPGNLFPKSSGGIYRVYFDKDFDGFQDGTFNITLAPGLPGFNSSLQDVTDLDFDNAAEDALKRLLEVLNFVELGFEIGPSGGIDNPIDIELTDVTIVTSSTSGIPFTWGPAEIKLEVGI